MIHIEQAGRRTFPASFLSVRQLRGPRTGGFTVMIISSGRAGSFIMYPEYWAR